MKSKSFEVQKIDENEVEEVWERGADGRLHLVTVPDDVEDGGDDA